MFRKNHPLAWTYHRNSSRWTGTPQTPGTSPQATAAFSDLSAIDYNAASGRIRDALKSANKLDAVALSRELDEHFREQYLRAESLARRGL